MMGMHSRNEYLKVLRERYLKARTRKEKSRILDEYCSNIGQARKYVIRKIGPGVDLRPGQATPAGGLAPFKVKGWADVRFD